MSHQPTAFLNARRVMEWANVRDELADLLEREWKLKIGDIRAGISSPGGYSTIHKALLSGVPRQFGLWDRESKSYRSANGGFFAVFPGSGLFSLPKRYEWVMAMELVETTRLWARRVARIEPEWVEQVAPHLCKSKYGEAHWDETQGAVYGKETVICGGLPVVAGRRIHYGRVDARAARNIFLREGVVAGKLKKRSRFLEHVDDMRSEIEAIEQKLRRPGGLWSDEAVLRFFEERIPEDINTAAAFHKWLEKNEDVLMLGVGDVVDEDLEYLGLAGFPDSITHAGQEYSLYYHTAQGERDDGVTLGVHVDQLPKLPDWLPAWGADGNLRERAEILLRSLPKDYRRVCQPIGPAAESFAELWSFAPKDRSIYQALSEHMKDRTGAYVPVGEYDAGKLPPELVTKIWVCDDEAQELAMGDDVAVLKLQLADRMRVRFEAAANADVERKGISSWDGESLPERVETPGGPAFPALVDEGPGRDRFLLRAGDAVERDGGAVQRGEAARGRGRSTDSDAARGARGARRRRGRARPARGRHDVPEPRRADHFSDGGGRAGPGPGGGRPAAAGGPHAGPPVAAGAWPGPLGRTRHQQPEPGPAPARLLAGPDHRRAPPAAAR